MIELTLNDGSHNPVWVRAEHIVGLYVVHHQQGMSTRLSLINHTDLDVMETPAEVLVARSAAINKPPKP